MLAEFKETCGNINNECIKAIAEVGEGRQVVEERIAAIATVVVRTLKIKQAGDLLLYAAAMNALNTYVKQDNNKKTFGYFFKKYVDVIIDYILENPEEGIGGVVKKDEANGMPFMLLEMYGLQVSFHGVSESDSVKRLKELNAEPGQPEIEFDEIRKQKCANTLFKGAFENTLLREDETLFTGNLTDDINAMLEQYDKGEITILDLKPQKHNKDRVHDKKADKAEALFRQGFNCSQSVFAAFADELGMSVPEAARIASPFGAGFGKLREVCGAVSGMTMLAGYTDGYGDARDAEGKKALYELVREMCAEFEKEQGSIICRDMLGLKKGEDIGEPAVRTEEYYTSRPCVGACRKAAEIAEKMLKFK